MSQSSLPVISEATTASLRRIRVLARLLDNALAIPFTKYRFGLDPILGVIPGIGDFLGTALSAYIVIEAARLGIPRAILGRMVFNVVLDGLVGSLPVLGDVFDFAFKASTRNAALVETYFNVSQNAQSPTLRPRSYKWLIFLLLVGLLIFGVVLVALGIILFGQLVKLFGLLVKAISG